VPLQLRFTVGVLFPGVTSLRNAARFNGKWIYGDRFLLTNTVQHEIAESNCVRKAESAKFRDSMQMTGENKSEKSVTDNGQSDKGTGGDGRSAIRWLTAGVRQPADL